MYRYYGGEYYRINPKAYHGIRRGLAPLESQGAVRTREHAKTALAVHIVQGRSGASAGYQALAHAPARAHRMDFRATQGVNLRTLAVRRFARCHG